MASGRGNALVGQVGEFLVCADLGRVKLISTPFSGNVPDFDVIAMDERCRTVPIQVKTSDRGDWRFDARNYLRVAYDAETRHQTVEGFVEGPVGFLIYVFVKLRQEQGQLDRFFVLTRREFEEVAREHYTVNLARHGGLRPKRSDSFHMAIKLEELARHENNWKIIKTQLEAAAPPSGAIASRSIRPPKPVSS